MVVTHEHVQSVCKFALRLCSLEDDVANIYNIIVSGRSYPGCGKFKIWVSRSIKNQALIFQIQSIRGVFHITSLLCW